MRCPSPPSHSGESLCSSLTSKNRKGTPCFHTLHIFPCLQLKTCPLCGVVLSRWDTGWLKSARHRSRHCKSQHEGLELSFPPSLYMSQPKVLGQAYFEFQLVRVTGSCTRLPFSSQRGSSAASSPCLNGFQSNIGIKICRFISPQGQ